MTEHSDLTRATVMQHLAAFNRHDTELVLRGVHDDVTWQTGADTYRGRASLLSLFDPWLWSLDPRIDVVRLIVENDAAAAECVETLLVDGERVAFAIAAFFTVRGNLLTTVKVFREGVADLA